MARDVEFNVTASDKTGAGLAKAERNFRQASERLKREQAKMSHGLGDGLGEGVKSGFMSGALAGKPLLIGAVAAAAPLMGGLISAGIIGGAGVGGIVGGAILASRDARVRAAGETLGTNLMASLTRDADVFVLPLLGAIDQVGDGFEDRLRPRIQGIFSDSAAFVQPLTAGILRGTDGILRGIEALTAKGKPVMDALGFTFDHLGESIGDAFETISGGSDEAAKALQDTAVALGRIVEGTAYVVRGLTETYGALHDVSTSIGDFVGFAGSADDATGEFTHRVSGLAAAAVVTAGPIATLSDRMNSYSDATRNAFDATTSVGAAMDAASEAARKNGKTLSANTEAGRANRAALSSLAKALIGQYNAEVQLNGEGRRSNEIAFTNRQSFIKLATSMGKSREAAGALATQMGLVPTKKNIDFHANTHDAAGRIAALRANIASVKGKTVTVTVQTRYPSGGRYEAMKEGQGKFDARDSFRASGAGGVARTGGPAPVAVSNEVNVSLDGRPFYQQTARVVSRSADREAFRQRVGKR